MLDWSQPAKKYVEEVQEFCRVAGIKSGSIPIIKRDEHKDQWREWYAYYKFRRLYGSMHLMEEKDEKTVPTLSPVDFDAAFVPPAFPQPVPKGSDNVPRKPGPTRLEMKTARYRSINAHLPILFEGVNNDMWRKLSKDRAVPEGAKWVAALGIVYGPEPKQIQQAAE